MIYYQGDQIMDDELKGLMFRGKKKNTEFR
jgi:hypothetical protein